MTRSARDVRSLARAAGRLATPRFLACGGVLACIAAVVAGVLSGGVPYPDGPNAGFASPPGARRVLEGAAGPLLGVGVLLNVAASVQLVWRLVRHLVRHLVRARRPRRDAPDQT